MKDIEQPIKDKANDVTKTTVTEEIAESQTKKESPKKESKQLANVDEKYQELCNLNYVRSAEARKELMELIDALWKINDIVLSKTSNHDLSVRYKGRQIVKVCPLKKGWSASVDGGKVQSLTKDQVLSGVRVMMTEPHKVIQGQEDKTVIKKLEDRIAKMSKNNKGIALGKTKITDGIKNWAKTKGYTLTGDTLLVNQAEQ